jgi:membrane protein
VSPRNLARWVVGLARSYSLHGDSQQAAAIAFRVLFSLVPLFALLVSVLDLVLPKKQRDALVHWLVNSVSGSSGLEDSLRRALEHGSATPSLTGLIAVLVLAWGASGMMASIRRAFANIWADAPRRDYVRGKLVDFVLVLSSGLVLVLAFGASIVVQTLSRLGADLGHEAGLSGLAGWFGTGVSLFATLLFVFVCLLGLYRAVPPLESPWSALWPGALVGAACLELATLGYRFYLDHFSNLSGVYGTLGALLGFLLVVYVGAAAMLVGAEIVAARPPRASHESSAARSVARGDRGLQ